MHLEIALFGFLHIFKTFLYYKWFIKTIGTIYPIIFHTKYSIIYNYFILQENFEYKKSNEIVQTSRTQRCAQTSNG
jgi:hypothetical protein